jgi:hypothetical protein
MIRFISIYFNLTDARDLIRFDALHNIFKSASVVLTNKIPIHTTLTTMSTPTPTASSISSSSNLRSLIYEVVDGKPTLQVLDQLLLPAEKKYITVPNIQTAWSVIHKMQIRGKHRASCKLKT